VVPDLGHAAVASVSPALDHGRVLRFGSSHNRFGGIAILNVGPGDQDRQHQSEGIGHEVPFATLHLFSRIEALHAPLGGGFHGLGVNDRSRGFNRTMLALMHDAYDKEIVCDSDRTVLRLHPGLAPVKVAVLPLLRKDGHPERAREIYEELRKHVSAEYDEGGHIGKRYRRQDEIGTPLAVTVDHQTLEDGTVTLRDRDSLSQDRVPAGELVDRVTQITR
jgi:hypothetical protein